MGYDGLYMPATLVRAVAYALESSILLIKRIQDFVEVWVRRIQPGLHRSGLDHLSVAAQRVAHGKSPVRGV